MTSTLVRAWLKRERKRRKLSQVDFGALIGQGQSVVAKWEKDQGGAMRLETLAEIAGGLGLVGGVTELLALAQQNDALTRPVTLKGDKTPVGVSTSSITPRGGPHGSTRSVPLDDGGAATPIRVLEQLGRAIDAAVIALIDREQTGDFAAPRSNRGARHRTKDRPPTE